jgi:hypothetical protein
MSKAPFPATTIKFEAMLTAGNEWQVVATFTTGHKKQIGGFKSEAEAVAGQGGYVPMISPMAEEGKPLGVGPLLHGHKGARQGADCWLVPGPALSSESNAALI